MNSLQIFNNAWKSKGIAEQELRRYNKNKNVKIVLAKPCHVMFEKKDDCLIQKTTEAKTTGPIVNVYIVYKTVSKNITSTNALRNSLFGAIKVTNTSTKDLQKYNYTGYGIAFSSNTFKHPDTGGTGKNVIIFGVNTKDFEKENNKKQSVMVLGYGLVKLYDTDIYTEKSYTPDSTSDKKITCLSLHYNGDNIYLLMVNKLLSLKSKTLKLTKIL